MTPKTNRAKIAEQQDVPAAWLGRELVALSRRLLGAPAGARGLMLVLDEGELFIDRATAAALIKGRGRR